MPAMIWCGRRWLAGTDDFVFGSFLHVGYNTLALLVLLIGTHTISNSLLTWEQQQQDISLPPSSSLSGGAGDSSMVATVTYLVFSLHVLIAVKAINIAVFLALGKISGKGRILEPSRRSLVPMLLYCACVTEFMHLIASSLVIHFGNQCARSSSSYGNGEPIHSHGDGKRTLVDNHNDGYVGTDGEALQQHPSRLVSHWIPVLSLLTSLWFYFSMILTNFDPMGSKNFETKEEYYSAWERRCRLVFRCFLSGAREEEQNAYLDASHTVAKLFQGLDIVPTDIMAGMVLLQGYQDRLARKRVSGLTFSKNGKAESERQEEMKVQEHDNHQQVASTGQVTVEEKHSLNRGAEETSGTRKKLPALSERVVSTQARRFQHYTDDQLDQLEKVEHFSRLMMGAYGYRMLVWQRPICGWCILGRECLKSTCCQEEKKVNSTSAWHRVEEGRQGGDHDDDDGDEEASEWKPTKERHTGDLCCQWNYSAMRTWESGGFHPDVTPGCHEADILYTHFKNDLYLPAFYVARCDQYKKKHTEEQVRPKKKKKDVICISIRGSCSPQDIMTDGVASPAPIDVQAVPGALAHSGILESAKNIQKVLKEHCPELLNRWLDEAQELVVAGHSLGAGTAVLLTILLREELLREAKFTNCSSDRTNDIFFEEHQKKLNRVNKVTGIGYAPPGALMSRNLSEYSRTFVIGCFLGKDLVPRLANHTIHSFRESLLIALASSERSKSTTLFHCCCPASSSSLLDESFDSSFEEETQLRLTRENKVRQELIQELRQQSREHLKKIIGCKNDGDRPDCDTGDLSGSPKISDTSRKESSEDSATIAGDGEQRKEEEEADITLEGVLKMYPPSNMIHYAKAESEIFQRFPGSPSSCFSPSPVVDKGEVSTTEEEPNSPASGEYDHSCASQCWRFVAKKQVHHYVPCWISVDDLQEVLCHPAMVSDHMPDTFRNEIMKAKLQRESGEANRWLSPRADATSSSTLNEDGKSLHFGSQPM